MTLVHPIEALEDPALVLPGDADTCIRHGEHHTAPPLSHGHIHPAALHIVLDGVAAQILDNFKYQAPDSGNRIVLTGYLHGNLLLLRRKAQGFGDFLRDIQNIHIFLRHFHALIQMAQANHILDEVHQPGGLFADIADKPLGILGLYQPVFQQLRTADDGLQRCLQLMGHIGGELPSVLLRVFRLCDVQRQNHKADGLLPGGNAAEEELINSSFALGFQLMQAIPERGFHSGSHFRLPLHPQEGSAHAVTVGVKQLPRRGIDAQHNAVAVQKHQPFPHIGGNLLQFVIFLPKGLHLRTDFFVLLLDANQQRGQFFVSIVLQRMLQIQLVQRLHNFAGHPVGQNRRQDDGQ